MVHLLQFPFGRLQSIWRRVELIGLEALIRESNSKWFVILLKNRKKQIISEIHFNAASNLGNANGPAEYLLHGQKLRRW
jgi:hypothetical protein